MANKAPETQFITLQQSLHQYGIALLDDLYSGAQIRHWNRAIDHHFQNQAPDERRYLSADKLHALGIATQVLSEDLLQTINDLMPDAVLYHFHSYDIPGNTGKPHIHSGNGLNGWHRDDDCFFGWEPDRFHFISFFVYLTPVQEQSGPFEIAPLNKDKPLKNKSDSIKVLGHSGCNFIFDRTFWHRANPNRSDKNRRVIKLSFQNRYLPNDRIELDEFTALRQSGLIENPIVKQLLEA